MPSRFDGDPEKQILALNRATREIKKATKEAERERRRLASERRLQHFHGLLDRLQGRSSPAPRDGVADYMRRRQARILDELRRPGRPKEGNEFIRESWGWRISFDGGTIRVPDWKGFAHLHALITHQEGGLACTDLLTIADGVHQDAEGIAPEDGLGSGSVRPARDRRTADALREGMQEIQSAIEAAEARGDEAEAESQRQRLDDVRAAISASYGLGEVERDLGAPQEKARKSVREAIKRALDKIEELYPSLASHLRASVRTGATCSYNPAKSADWRVTSSDSA